MAQQSNPAREWHSVRVATVQCCIQCVGGRGGLDQGHQEYMVSVGTLAGEGKAPPRVLAVLNASPGLM